MLPDGTVEIERVWKRFRADRARQILRDKLTLKHMRTRDEEERWRWVLKDINVQVKPGESIGLVGANGSGKSTLLKILTGVMYPHSGRVALHGRVGALLEVRAGLHSDLSGRENVYLYGTLLGLDRKTIDARFDQIVDFADLGDAIERQLKFYSSGMQMRLGFSIAAFLEPNVLLVDEALAVGDAFFQQRCLERMRDLLDNGTTLVLVSHDLAAIESVCDRGVWLRYGEVGADGPIRDVLTDYRRWIEENSKFDFKHGGTMEVVEARVRAEASGEIIKNGRPATVTLTLQSPVEQSGELILGISEGTAAPVFIVSNHVKVKAGTTTVHCHLPTLPLATGRYFVWMEFADDSGTTAVRWHPVTAFRLSAEQVPVRPVGVMRLSPVQVPATWDVDDIDGEDSPPADD